MVNVFQRSYPIINSFAPRIRAALGMHPEEILGRLLLKLGYMPWLAARFTVLGELHRSRPGRLPDLMREIEQAFTAATGNASPEYTAKNVLEIGCGVRGGIGPLAAARHSSSYLGVDPGVVPTIFADSSVRRRYLEPTLHAAAIAEELSVSEDTLLSHFDATCLYSQCSLEELETRQAQYDLAVSISCLEHIFQLESALSSLRLIMAPAARHFHLVNFSNHLSKTQPFSEIYEMTPEVYWRRHGQHINLLRPDDFKMAFSKAGWDVDVTPLDIRADVLPDATMDPWWTERYSKEELSVRTAIISSAL